jgi:hypothetical protein
MNKHSDLDWPYIGVFTLVVWVPLAVYLVGLDVRLISMLLGSAAIMGLGYRVVGDYPDTPALGRAAAFLLLLTLLFGAVGQYQLHTWNTPLTAVSYPILGHRVACLILAIYWPRWIHTTKTPFRKYSDEDLRPKGLST